MAELTNEIFIKDIPSERARDKEYLELYLEDVSGGVVTDVEFLWDGLCASVSFEEKIDFRNLEEEMSNKPYSGHHVSISIPQPIDTILIEGIPAKSHKDDVILHFENKRFGGSDTKYYCMMPHVNTAVIQYENPEVVDSVLSLNHIIHGKEVRVRKYNRNIEPFPPAIPPSEADGSHEDNIRGKHVGNASHDMKNNTATSQSNFPDDNKHEKEHFQSDGARVFDRGAGLPSGAKAVPINDGVNEHHQIFASKQELKLAPVNSGSARPSANMPGYAKKPPGTYGIRSEDEEAMENDEIGNEKRNIQKMHWQPSGERIMNDPSHSSHDDTRNGAPNPHRVASDPLGAEGGADYRTSRSSDNASGSDGGSFPADQSKSSSENKMRGSKFTEHPNPSDSNSYNEDRKTAEDIENHDNFEKEPSRTRSGSQFSAGYPNDKSYAGAVAGSSSGKGKGPFKIVLKKGVWRMLKTHMRSDVTKASTVGRYQSVFPEFYTDCRSEWSIIFSGEDAFEAKANVEKLSKNILYKTSSKSKPGLYCIFNQPGQNPYWLSLIEDKHKCCIEVRKSRGSTAGTGTHQNTRSQISPTQSKWLHMQLNTSIGNLRVIILKGDIVNLPQKVDVLVNPIVKGNSLDKGGAIAKAFLKKGGQDLQKAIDKKSFWKTDDVIVTKSCGNINSKVVYHLRYDTWGPKTDKILSGTVNYCLEEAHKFKNKSIAFPTIGCGLMKYPVSKVAEILYKEITKYDKNHSSPNLKEVYIVAFDEKLFIEFTDEFTSHLTLHAGAKQKTNPSNATKRQDTDSETGFPQQSFATTVFHINGLSDESIEAALRDLEYKISEEYHQIDFTISNLNQRDRDYINDLQTKNVILQIDEKNKKVIVCGKTFEVKSAYRYLDQYFTNKY